MSRIIFIFFIVACMSINLYADFPDPCCDLCDEYVYVGETPGDFPDYPRVDFDIDWGEQGSVIEVDRCGNESPAKGKIIFKFLGGDPNSPYELPEDWYWNNCTEKDGNFIVRQGEIIYPPYNFQVSFKVKCEVIGGDPNDSEENDNNKGVVTVESDDEIFGYPTCDTYEGGEIIVGLAHTDCETLKRARHKQVKVIVQAYMEVYTTLVCTETDGNLYCITWDAICLNCEPCMDISDEIEGPYRGKLIYTKDNVGVKFIDGFPCEK